MGEQAKQYAVFPLHPKEQNEWRRWKPMIEMFVQNYDYRKKLTETVDRSIVYKGDRRVAKFAEVIRSFRIDESSKKVEELQKKIDLIDKDLEAMKELMKWAKS